MSEELRKAVFGEADPRFRQHLPEYHGVLVNAGEVRLSVSANGSRYLLQQASGDVYTVHRWRKSLRLLWPDLPEPIRAAAQAAALPDDPGQLSRPWAEAQAKASAEYRRLKAAQVAKAAR